MGARDAPPACARNARPLTREQGASRDANTARPPQLPRFWAPWLAGFARRAPSLPPSPAGKGPRLISLALLAQGRRVLVRGEKEVDVSRGPLAFTTRPRVPSLSRRRQTLHRLSPVVVSTYIGLGRIPPPQPPPTTHTQASRRPSRWRCFTCCSRLGPWLSRLLRWPPSTSFPTSGPSAICGGCLRPPAPR